MSRDTRLRALKRQATAVGHAQAHAFPWRRHVTLYRTLIAEILLQKTPADRVAGVYSEFIGRWPSFRTLRQARRSEVEAVLQSLGLQRRRAEVVLALARFAHTVRPDEGALRRQSGVGPYTAGITSTVLTRRPTGFADGGVARLICRYFGLRPTVRRAAADASVLAHVAQVVSTVDPRATAWGIVDLSRTVCARTPRCERCAVRSTCATARGGTYR